MDRETVINEDLYDVVNLVLCSEKVYEQAV